MKLNIFNTKLFLFGLAITSLTACVDDDIEGQDAEFGTKPIATAETTSITVAEGEADAGVTFNISEPTNKITYFRIQVLDGNTATEDADFTAGTGDTRGEVGTPGEGFEMRVPAFAESFTIPINAVSDIQFQEGTETVSLLVSAAAQRAILTVDGGVQIDVTITNVATPSPDGLVGGLSWPTDQADDLDLVAFNDQGQEVGFAATADNPEMDVIIPSTSPDGTYFVNIGVFDDPVPDMVDFTVGLLANDGSGQDFTSTLDLTNTDQYTIDFSGAVLGIDTYRFIQVEKSGNNYSYTQLF